MNRPLETTFWMRFKQFMKGAFLYNTIYWRRASDDLNIQRMSREERASLRPKRNLEIIRPRERARAHLTEGALSLPPEYTERSNLAAGGQVSLPESEPAPKLPIKGEEEDGVVEIHRRKKRRASRHSRVTPKRYLDFSNNYKGGLLGWLFKK